MNSDDDLFDIANALARLIDAPITIEDRDTIVVAYSSGDQDVDDARIGTILRRQVPVRYRAAIEAAGVLDQLAEADGVVMVDLPEVEMIPRAVVAVRDGGVLVGSIWAAVNQQLSHEQSTALLAAAPVVARGLRHARERADSRRRQRTDLMRTLLAGGEAAEEVAAEHAIEGPCAVVALRGLGDDAPPQLWGALSLHLSAIAPAAVCAPVGQAVYAILDANAAPRLMSDFLQRFSMRDDVVAGIGSPSRDAHALSDSRSVADDIAASLRRRGRSGVVASLADVFADVLVDRLETYVRAHPDANPLRRLVEYDRAHAAGLVDAVRAYLDTGHVSGAARVLHVHPNTVRNRIRRARQECGIDVGDADTRMSLMIALRLNDRGADVGTTPHWPM